MMSTLSPDLIKFPDGPFPPLPGLQRGDSCMAKVEGKEAEFFDLCNREAEGIPWHWVCAVVADEKIAANPEGAMTL